MNDDLLKQALADERRDQQADQARLRELVIEGQKIARRIELRKERIKAYEDLEKKGATNGDAGHDPDAHAQRFDLDDRNGGGTDELHAD